MKKLGIFERIAAMIGGRIREDGSVAPEPSEPSRRGEGAQKRSDRMREKFAGVRGNWERAAGSGRWRWDRER